MLDRRGRDLERENLMALRRLSGETLLEIGVDYGISRERVRQLVARHGEIKRPSLHHWEPLEVRDSRFLHPDRTGGTRWSFAALHRNRKRRRALVAGLRVLVEKLGRAPKYAEVTAHFGLHWRGLGHYFMGAKQGSWRRLGLTESRGMYRWFRLAGVRPWKTGSGRGARGLAYAREGVPHA